MNSKRQATATANYSEWVQLETAAILEQAKGDKGFGVEELIAALRA
jgi:hypothetical protein